MAELISGVRRIYHRRGVLSDSLCSAKIVEWRCELRMWTAESLTYCRRKQPRATATLFASSNLGKTRLITSKGLLPDTCTAFMPWDELQKLNRFPPSSCAGRSTECPQVITMSLVAFDAWSCCGQATAAVSVMQWRSLGVFCHFPAIR